MKKTFLAVTMLSAVSLSGVANAAFVEGNNFTGSLDFNGTITNDNPIWAWEVPMAGTANVQNWDALVINGVVNGSNTEYSFASKPAMTLIHGYMKTSSPTGGAGITPVIKVGNTGSEITLSGDSAQQVIVEATGKDASDAAVPMGTMTFNAQAFLGGATFDNTTSRYFGSNKAQPVLANNQDNFTTNYPGTIVANNQNYAQSVTAFRNQSNKNLSGAYLAEISNYKLAFPSATLPATWSAIIPVTVTLN